MMRRKLKKAKRHLRGTMIMHESDAANVKKFLMPNG